MALFEGEYQIHFYIDNLLDDRKEQFIEFIKKWREDHPFKYDNWIENLDYDSFSSVLLGGNDPDNIEDLHNFLIEAAKEFPELEADGDGHGDDVASGSWSTEYSFTLKNGELQWDENEWSQDKEDERLMNDVINKPIPDDYKRSLKEILPNLDESLPNGLIIEDGILRDFDSGYSDYLGAVEGDVYYFPPEVEGFDKDFDYFEDGYQTVIDDFVITTNIKDIPVYSFGILGFENFYIIDADTKETVFYTNRFLVPDEVCDGLVFDLNLFFEFAKDYYEDPYKAIHNSDYGVAVDSE